MNRPARRFFLYALIGLLFGLIDWFYLDWLAHHPWGSLVDSILIVPIILAMNYSIWLVPILPVVVYDARSTRTIYSPVFAGMLTWCCAMVSYYAYYAALLSLGKLPHLEHLNVFGEKPPSFWHEYWQMFNRIILGQFLEWILVAVIGGAIIGALAYWLNRKISPERFRLLKGNR